MRDEAGHQNQIGGSVTDNLIRDSPARSSHTASLAAPPCTPVAIRPGSRPHNCRTQSTTGTRLTRAPTKPEHLYRTPSDAEPRFQLAFRIGTSPVSSHPTNISARSLITNVKMFLPLTSDFYLGAAYYIANWLRVSTITPDGLWHCDCWWKKEPLCHKSKKLGHPGPPVQHCGAYRNTACCNLFQTFADLESDKHKQGH
jgi:hypothetical protein